MKRTVLAALIFAAWGVDIFAAGEIYMTLDFPGARYTFANGISGNAIVGAYSASLYPTHGFVYDGNSFTTIDFPGSVSTQLIDIDGNRIVGSYDTSGSSAQRHGFIYENGIFTTLDHPMASPLYFNGTEASGISGGKVVGSYLDAGTFTHGYVYDGTTFTTLVNPFSNDANATGIDGSKIVGSYDGGDHGYLYDGATFTHLDGPLGTTFTVPSDIFGDNVVGYYVNASQQHGFLFNGTTFSTLDEPATLGGDHFNATGIYGSTIVGTYQKAGRIHGFVTIPEPASFGFALASILSLCGYRFRGRRNKEFRQPKRRRGH